MKLPELRIGRHVATVPIVQGGMSIRVSTSSLAAAVAERGGIGTIGGSAISPEDLAADVRRAKSMTKGIVAANVMYAVRGFEESVMAAIDAGVDLIATGAGFSRSVFKIGRDRGVPIVSIISSPEGGRLAERCGAAAIVVEAKEAGGHLGTDRPLRELFPEVRRTVTKVPLIAAGGITDGADVAEMIGRFGADGVQMATRFVLTRECDVSDVFKRVYLGARREDVVVMKSPVGMPGRAIVTPFLKRLNAGEDLHDGLCPTQCLKSCDRLYCISRRLLAAREGDVENGLFFVGENVWRIKDVPTVRELMDRLVADAEADGRLTATA